jgi:hypothetical protein
MTHGVQHSVLKPTRGAIGGRACTLSSKPYISQAAKPSYERTLRTLRHLKWQGQPHKLSMGGS